MILKGLLFFKNILIFIIIIFFLFFVMIKFNYIYEKKDLDKKNYLAYII